MVISYFISGVAKRSRVHVFLESIEMEDAIESPWISEWRRNSSCLPEPANCFYFFTGKVQH